MATATQETANQSKTRTQREFSRHHFQESVIVAAGSFGYGIEFEKIAYTCTTVAGGPADCKFKEEFTYNNTYGWVKWQYWTSTGSAWSWQKTSLHDHLKPNDGNSGVFFPCF
jgi:hypothetical protein